MTYAAWVWGAMGVVGMVAGLAVGSLSTRFGLRAAILFCYLCFLLAGAILALAPRGPLPVAAGILFSLGFYAIFGLLPAYVSHRTTVAAAVTIFGISNVAQGLGGTAGNVAAGAVKGATQGFAGIYLGFAVLVLACALLSSRLRRDVA